MSRQEKAAQMRPEPADDPGRQRGHDPRPRRRGPATAALSTTSRVLTPRSCTGPRRRWPGLACARSLASSIPDGVGRVGGRGGKPFSRATSSRKALFSSVKART